MHFAAVHESVDGDKAREVFASAIYHRPRIRLTIRQRSHVLEEWPKAAR